MLINSDNWLPFDYSKFCAEHGIRTDQIVRILANHFKLTDRTIYNWVKKGRISSSLCINSTSNGTPKLTDLIKEIKNLENESNKKNEIDLRSQLQSKGITSKEFIILIEQISGKKYTEQTINCWKKNNNIPLLVKKILENLDKHLEEFSNNLEPVDKEPYLEKIPQEQKEFVQKIMEKYNRLSFLDVIVWSEAKLDPKTGKELKLPELVKNFVNMFKAISMDKVGRVEEAIKSMTRLKQLPRPQETFSEDEKNIEKRIYVVTSQFLIIKNFDIKRIHSISTNFEELNSEIETTQYNEIKTDLMWNKVNAIALYLNTNPPPSDLNHYERQAKDAFCRLSELKGKQWLKRKIAADPDLQRIEHLNEEK